MSNKKQEDVVARHVQIWRHGIYIFAGAAVGFLIACVFSILIGPVLDRLWPSCIYSGCEVVNRNKQALEIFQTFTVETTFSMPAVKEVVGFNKDSLNELILKEISALVEKKFGKGISSSQYGMPYSFDTNPLNVAIVFRVYVYQNEGPSPTFAVTPIVKRSRFFTLFKNSMRDPKEYSRVVRWDWEEGIPIRLGYQNFLVYLHTKEDLLKQIRVYTEKIVEDMSPQIEEASKAEAQSRKMDSQEKK